MKKNLKLVLGITFVFVMMISLTGCGKETNKPNNDNKPSQQQTGGSQNTDNSQKEEKKVITDGSKLGVLQAVVEQEDFIIKGLYIDSDSGQHEYKSVDEIETFGIENLNSEYELNEWIRFYVDTDNKTPMSIYFVKNNTETDYSKITIRELEKICSDKEYPVLTNVVPDPEENGLIGTTYVNPESSTPDLFNVFITSNGKVYYMVQLKLIAENSTVKE